MIEGLKITVSGTELRTLCLTQAGKLKAKAERALEQADVYETAEVQTGVQQSTSNRDPVEDLRAAAVTHNSNAQELVFIADHLEPLETYLLGREDLYRLGIIKERF